MTNKIMELTKAHLADTVAYAGKWKGYDVYNLIYNKPVCLGLPCVILVRGEEVRTSTVEEAFDYMDDTMAARKTEAYEFLEERTQSEKPACK